MKRTWILGVFTTACLWACSQNDGAKEVIDALAVEIAALAGDGTCDNAEACSTVAFGSKPCGGPWSYIIYCADTVDEDALHASVSEHAELEHQYNIDNAIASDCSEATEPSVELVDGVCVAVTGS